MSSEQMKSFGRYSQVRNFGRTCFGNLNDLVSLQNQRKERKKGLITILLIIGVIAFQNFAPNDFDLRMKIEDAVDSITDLLP